MARFLALVQTLERVPVPTIAVVHALNLTIGFELSLGCDLMWAAEDASFGRARSFAARLAAGPTAATAVGKRLQTARDHGVAAADAVTARETGQIFATRDLTVGLTSLLEKGPRQATFEGR